MPAIWTRTADGWRLADPSGFPDEAALHDLVAQTPEMLPLAGSPQLVILGREVRLGSGRADLLAVERAGRPVVIEIKLARNAEARRAVVAQVLAYAAVLHGHDSESLAQEMLQSHLHEREATSVAELVERSFQDRDFNAAVFTAALDQHLADGSLRLVVVLDAAPNELVELAGYLETVTRDRLQIDLVVVSAYEVGGVPVMVPQRIDPERPEAPPTSPGRAGGGALRAAARPVESGAQGWFEVARDLRPDDATLLDRLERWAATIQEERLADLGTFRGAKWVSLLARLRPENAGMVAFFVHDSMVVGQLFRSSIERRAPQHLPVLERIIGKEIGQGTGIPQITDELLAALLDAYRAAAGAQ